MSSLGRKGHVQGECPVFKGVANLCGETVAQTLPEHLILPPGRVRGRGGVQTQPLGVESGVLEEEHREEGSPKFSV